VRAANATDAPSRANANAMARPMPRPPPVMNANRFSNFMLKYLECGGKRSATPLWMSDKLQFVDDLSCSS
jgi:hypothetical protein